MNKKIKTIIMSCFMSFILFFSFILPTILNTKNQIKTRNIDVEELGTVSYEEKVEQIKNEFDSYEIEENEEILTFTGSINIENLNYLSSGDDPIESTEIYSSTLNKQTEEISISKSISKNDEITEDYNDSFKLNYDEENDDYILTNDEGLSINILDELNDESNVNECFCFSLFAAAFSIKAIVKIAVVVVAAVTVVSATKYIAQNSDLIDRELDNLLSNVNNTKKSVFERLKLRLGYITAAALTGAVSLTESRAKKLYDKLKNKTNCYILCGTITGSGYIPIKYKATDLQNAINWIKKGGSVWSPLSTNAEACITGAGYTPGIVKNNIPAPYVAERHNITFMANNVKVDFGFYHYHALNKVTLTKFAYVHSFFGQPFSGSPVK